ncbi:transcriptional regulator [Imhoffiella purpurea]|uniref:Uncharacterized protein n=1 Tax=Imhoffiella purpurea TaxID=1249627 RepID=W9V5S3_9GAMM|nr:hypothetical protein [Imhoffiella purpurea]EXJ14873.1 hypothetical protein D779_2079 [Imhoffiella purpurea]
MTDPAAQTPRKRGRKPTGNAMTGAERQRRYLERLKAGANIVTDTKPDNAVSDRINVLERELAAAQQTIKAQLRERAEHERTIRDLRARVSSLDTKLRQVLEERVREGERLIQERDEARAALKAVTDDNQPSDEELSDRDRRIRDLYQQGTAKRAIGRELGISDGTVRNVLGRLGVD